MPCLAWVCPFPKACLRSCAYWSYSFSHMHNASWEWTDLRVSSHVEALKEEIARRPFTALCYVPSSLRAGKLPEVSMPGLHISLVLSCVLQLLPSPLGSGLSKPLHTSFGLLCSEGLGEPRERSYLSLVIQIHFCSRCVREKLQSGIN